MTRIGYARVSTTDQDLSIQIAALKAAGCDVIRAEKASGTSTTGREELRTILDFIRSRDELVVTRIDRLARSIADLQDIVRTLKAKGAALKATEQPIAPRRQPVRRSSTCWACSLSSRLTYGASGRWKA
jgi:DNA invertase Pin-like site-specific DNA recombinase